MDWFLHDNGLRHEGVKKHGAVYCLSRAERAVFQYPKLCDFAITSFRNISQSFRKVTYGILHLVRAQNFPKNSYPLIKEIICLVSTQNFLKVITEELFSF